MFNIETKEVGNGCIEVINRKHSPWGTVAVRYKGKSTNYHRVLWELKHGEVQGKARVLRSCGNSKCVNVDHMTCGNSSLPEDITTRLCSVCGETKSIEEFGIRSGNVGGREHRCKGCKSKQAQQHYYNNVFKTGSRTISKRAKVKGLPFNLTPKYLESIWTGRCAYYNTPISLIKEEGATRCTAALDRIVPSLGYVKGNVVYASQEANRRKDDCSPEDLRLLADKIDYLLSQQENLNAITKT